MGVSIKTILTICVILLFAMAIVGCQTKTDDTLKDDTTKDTTGDEVTDDEPEVVEQELTMSQDVADLLAKNSKVKYISYVYKDSDRNAANYVVKGPLVKMSFDKMMTYNGFEYYTVYFDSDKGTVFLACEKRNECKGLRAKEAMWADFYRENPLEIAAKITNGDITESVQIENKNTDVIAYTNSDGDSEKIWVWDYWGVPVKREIMRDGIKFTIDYSNLVVNPATEETVAMPTNLELM